jgi:hypothetical protein
MRYIERNRCPCHRKHFQLYRKGKCLLSYINFFFINSTDIQNNKQVQVAGGHSTPDLLCVNMWYVNVSDVCMILSVCTCACHWCLMFVHNTQACALCVCIHALASIYEYAWSMCISVCMFEMHMHIHMYANVLHMHMWLPLLLWYLWDCPWCCIHLLDY